ncbi:MAG: NAD-dependent epimerase/dehydratase family protein [Actinophytocola sp.]|nr:NAD-dependent epimerase/dehydratase family protein [Actinophytocola sp.]
MVAVTGGAGRLGRSVVRVLADAGREVVSIDLPGTAAPDGARASVPADLTDAEQTHRVLADIGPSAVVHLAAIAVPFSRPETELLPTNVALAHNVCDAAVRIGCRSVVVASSPTVLGYGNPAGWRPDYLPLDENHPARPWHAYALSKLATELMVRMYADRNEATHFSVVRPGYVIAPEEWRGSPTQGGHTVADRLAGPALGAKSLFNYVDARDAGELVGMLLDAQGAVPSGEVFFACAADPLAAEPLAELLPEFHPGIAAHASGLGHGEPAFSIGKAERLLGWRPLRDWRTELSAVTT